MKDALLTFIGIFLYYFKYKNFLSQSTTDIQNFQFRKLKKLLIKSCEIPYYQDLFDKIKFDPKSDFNSISDLQKIPILSKETVRNNPELFINQRLKKQSLVFKTSGTTGKPFVSYVSFKHWVVEQAVIWRHWKWSGYHLFDSMAILRSHNPKNENDIIKYDRIRRWTYYSPYHLNDKWMEIFYFDMLKKKTKYLRGYPSSLSLFAEFCIRKGYKLPNLRACLTASEVLSHSERKTIEEAFLVKVYDHYGLAEAVVMIHNRGDRNKYINCDEYGYLEFVSTDVDNHFKIIGTNLNNYTMPLIRYDTEDISEIENVGESISIKSIIGRKDVYIQTEMTQIPTVNLYTVLYKVEGISQWQIIQNDKKTLDVYVKVKNDYDFEIIKNEIDKLNSTGLNFIYHKTDVFLKVGEGKLKPFISNI